MMELKLLDPLAFISTAKTFNRTMMELKRPLTDTVYTLQPTFNRTMMELKRLKKLI